MKGGQREGSEGLGAQLLLPSVGNPQRLGFHTGIKNPLLGQKVGTGLGLWREWVWEDFLEEVVRGTYPEGWDGSLRREVDLEQGPGGAA